jgi:hypothetical protein
MFSHYFRQVMEGAFAYGFFTVVPTLYEVPLEAHLTYHDALMRHNGVYMQIAMVASILIHCDERPRWMDRRVHSCLRYSYSLDI